MPGYYRIAVENGIATVAICFGLFACGCWLCALGDADCSPKHKIGLQGLGLILLIAAGPVAIVGGYRITHSDWGLFGFWLRSTSLPMLQHAFGISV